MADGVPRIDLERLTLAECEQTDRELSGESDVGDVFGPAAFFRFEADQFAPGLDRLVWAYLWRGATRPASETP